MSNIEWTNETWNPVVGCSKVSAGCANCYAEKMAVRLKGMGNESYQGVVDERGLWTGKVTLVPHALSKPLKWTKPRKIFVCSMADLFHEAVPFEYIDRVFAVMALSPQHTFQILTKRPERMAEYLNNPSEIHWAAMGGMPARRECCARNKVIQINCNGFLHKGPKGRLIDHAYSTGAMIGNGGHWPLPNVWLGTSVENQKAADERIPHLLRCPAAVRFLSCEPLLEPLNLSGWFNPVWQEDCGVCGWPGRGPLPAGNRIIKRSDDGNAICPDCADTTLVTSVNPSTQEHDGGLHWVIVGGESGPGARPCDVENIRSIVQQCKADGVPVFVKQLGTRPCGLPQLLTIKGQRGHHKGNDPEIWPEDLRVREFPTIQNGGE